MSLCRTKSSECIEKTLGQYECMHWILLKSECPDNFFCWTLTLSCGGLGGGLGGHPSFCNKQSTATGEAECAETLCCTEAEKPKFEYHCPKWTCMLFFFFRQYHLSPHPQFSLCFHLPLLGNLVPNYSNSLIPNPWFICLSPFFKVF